MRPLVGKNGKFDLLGWLNEYRGAVFVIISWMWTSRQWKTPFICHWMYFGKFFPLFSIVSHFVLKTEWFDVRDCATMTVVQWNNKIFLSPIQSWSANFERNWSPIQSWSDPVQSCSGKNWLQSSIQSDPVLTVFISGFEEHSKMKNGNPNCGE